MTARRTAAALRAQLQWDLVTVGWAEVEVASACEWQAVHRAGVLVAGATGLRVHSRLHGRRDAAPWPGIVSVWDADRQADPVRLLGGILARRPWAQSPLGLGMRVVERGPAAEALPVGDTDRPVPRRLAPPPRCQGNDGRPASHRVPQTFVR